MPKLGFSSCRESFDLLMLSCLIFSGNIVGVCVSFNTRVFLFKLVLNLNLFGFDSGLFLATLFYSLRLRGNVCFFLVTSMFVFRLIRWQHR